MSHFTVLVIGNDVSKILAPYDENMSVEPYIEKSKRELIEEFHKLLLETRARKSIKHIETKNMFSANPIEVETEENDAFLCRILDTDITNPKQFAEWVKKYHGKNIDEDGNMLSTYNPKSKWDWFSIGGRWVGTFPLKEGKSGKRGKASLIMGEVEDNGRVDSAKVGDIDWDLLNREEAEHVEKRWDSFMNLTAEGTFGKYNAEYMIAERERLLKKYGSKEEYIRRTGKWRTYAVVNKDGWFAPGEMGWWGMSSDTEEDGEVFTESFFEKFIKPLPKNTIVTLVDCHI